MKSQILLPMLTSVLFILSACNGVSSTSMEYTQEPATVTVNTIVPSKTMEPTVTGIATETAVPATATVVTTQSTQCLDSAAFVSDVSIPDGTNLMTDTDFVKTWRVKNTGTCTWNNSYSLVFTDGTLMMPVDRVPLSATVSPGQSIDLSLDMTSPIYPGAYESDWKFLSPDGSKFGVGKKDSPLWVKINIGSAQPYNVIAGFVYMDLNGNQSYDYNGDQSLANRTIQLQQGNCTQGGTILTTALSGSDGRYTLSGNFSGTLCVALQGNQVMDDVVSVNLTNPNGTTTMIDLRAATPDASITGRIWDDTTQPDGSQQAGEASLSGVNVLIQKGPCGDLNSVPVAIMTDSQGNFQFTQLYGGTYCISIRAGEGSNSNIPKSGAWTTPTNGIQQVTVQPGEQKSVNFGWQFK